MVDRLLAKSRHEGDELSESMLLHGHLADVSAVGCAVTLATAEHQVRALGLAEACVPKLKRCVALAGALHDLGKANDHFLDMLERGVRPQGIRHEWVTVLMLAETTLGEWLRRNLAWDPVEWFAVEWAIAGHHPAYKRATPPARTARAVELIAFVGHRDFSTAIADLRTTFEIEESPPCLGEFVQWPLVGSDDVFTRLARWSRRQVRAFDELSQGDKRFVAAVKNSLIAADIAGSALPRLVSNRAGLSEWAAMAFDSRPRPGDLATVARHRLGINQPRAFQEAVAMSVAPITFVKAGCGTGKTVAAYLWAARQYPTRRLFFCYPTTGTTTEGFRGYLHEPDGELGEIGGRLFHSRAEVDFEIILDTGADLDDSGEDADRTEEERIARVEALDAWSTPVACCTVDTVLGVIQNHKRGLYSWPALSQAAFVFDEIHAYDEPLFASLLRFLIDLPGVPVLLMTASLPNPRLQGLLDVMHRRDLELPIISGPEALEIRARYRLIADVEPFQCARKEIASGGKVLWVSNTVRRAMDVADGLRGLSPFVYHSRFKYEDRVQRHKDVINAFERPGAALAVCTQVAEMSLDLSATMLISDLAPVPALIQRLGRLNRRAESGDLTRPFLVLPVGAERKDCLPYEPNDLLRATEWLKLLPSGDISQRDLAEIWEDFDVGEVPTPADSAWIDSGPNTRVGDLRSGSIGLSVLMAEDLPEVRGGVRTARRVVPMPAPKHLNWRSWPTHRGLPVAPIGTINYDRSRGASW